MGKQHELSSLTKDEDTKQQLETVVVESADTETELSISVVVVPDQPKNDTSKYADADPNELTDKCTPAPSDYNYMEDPANRHSSFKFRDIKWPNTIGLTLVHILGAWGLYRYAMGQMMWQTALLAWAFMAFSALGVTAGAHRLWCHRSYKAKWPLRAFLAFANTTALEMDIYDWCRDHRVHHKFSDTNADPHNINRGFFFSHIGWLLTYKHPDVKKKGKLIDLSDLWADPIIRFQRRYYEILVLLFWAGLPVAIAVFGIGETPTNAFLLCVMLRQCYVMHATFIVNSVAHTFGNRPYKADIPPTENRSVVYFSFGEGYHNYHHVFPWDYSASEFGPWVNFNLTTMFIEQMEKLGLAYDLKKPSHSLVMARMKKHGDQTVKPTSTLFRIYDWTMGIVTNMSMLIVLFALRAICTGINNDYIEYSWWNYPVWQLPEYLPLYWAFAMNALKEIKTFLRIGIHNN